MFETTNQSTYSPKPMSWYWYGPFESPNSARPKLRSWASPAGMPHLNFIPSPQYHTHPKVSANMRKKAMVNPLENPWNFWGSLRLREGMKPSQNAWVSSHDQLSSATTKCQRVPDSWQLRSWALVKSSSSDSGWRNRGLDDLYGLISVLLWT
jgi:hypothetical protein